MTSEVFKGNEALEEKPNHDPYGDNAFQPPNHTHEGPAS